MELHEASSFNQKSRQEAIPVSHYENEEPLSLKEIEAKYDFVNNWIDARLRRDVSESTSEEIMKKREADLNVLQNHNKIHFSFTRELVKAENLSKEEEVVAFIASKGHDAAKLSVLPLEHGQKSADDADEMLKQIMGREIDGVMITPERAAKVKEAIERHMNHPFMVMLNGGERFVEPQDKIDKIIFDADMLANIGFKNVAFRINNESFIKTDTGAATDGKILEETFRNVFEGGIGKEGARAGGVKDLKDVVLLDSAKEMADGLIEKARQIYQEMLRTGIISEVQKSFSDEEGNFNVDTIKEKGGPEVLKKRLNEEIEKTAMALSMDMEIVKKFEM